MSTLPHDAPDAADAHREAQALLPWLANCTLAPAELARVEAHLLDCAACRADLDTLYTVRGAGQAPLPELDLEGALARLLPRLDAPVAQPAAALPAAPGWRGRLAANDRRWLRAAVGLQFGVIAVLGALLARTAGSGDAPAHAYQVLGAASGPSLTLVASFRPDTPEAELRRIVLASGAHIVGGPTVTGAWVLGTEQAPAEVAARLRAEPAVSLLRVLFALLACACCWSAQAGDQASADPLARATSHQVLVMLRLPAQHFRPDASYGGGYLKDGGSAARRRVAAEIAAAHGLRLLDSWAMPAIGVDCFVMEQADDAPVERVAEALVRDARVAWAQPLADYYAQDGGDPLYPLQPAAQDWRLAELHRVSTGRSVNVAVVDSGVDAAHADLAGRIGVRRNFVDDGPDVAEVHGTAVAGIIGARSGNGVGIAGVAPGARIMALRACWESGARPARCKSLTLAKAINYALENDARIINLSLAGPPDRLLRTLLQAALARGVVVVGAADPQLPDGGFPASLAGVIGVARSGDRHPAPSTLLFAPGTDIPTCVPGNRWNLVSGSSYAAAHVAGLAALLMELKPRSTMQALRQRPTDGLAAAAGGTIDACAALSRAADTCVCLCTTTTATLAPVLR